MSYAQAAAILDLLVGTIRSHLSRGRDALRKLMDIEAKPAMRRPFKASPERAITRIHSSRGTQDALEMLLAAAARTARKCWEENMGRGILLWLLGVPIPIIILLALFWH
jgi:hypothetical protein